MIKYFFIYLLSFTVLYFFAIALHEWILYINDIHIRYQLNYVYLFFAIISFLICVIFKILTFIPKAKEQLGFFYMPTIFLKIILFFFVFNNSIVGLPNLTKSESLNLLTPLFIFLGLEVIFLYHLLNKKTDGIIKKI
ncbi:DUF6168 family protein [Confluentibacter lentus]|uniref:DUF6168 family protein n=1 Tax=Confluentibacter lentus TaxID=1699412 RepID=UPI0037430C54